MAVVDVAVAGEASLVDGDDGGGRDLVATTGTAVFVASEAGAGGADLVATTVCGLMVTAVAAATVDELCCCCCCCCCAGVELTVIMTLPGMDVATGTACGALLFLATMAAAGTWWTTVVDWSGTCGLCC